MRRLPRLISGLSKVPPAVRWAWQTTCLPSTGSRLQPRVLNDVGKRSTAVHFLGQDYDGLRHCPHGHVQSCSPKGRPLSHECCPRAQSAAGCFHRRINPAGGFHQSAPGRVWFQLYVVPPLEHTLSLVRRAEECGYETLVLTVDVPQVGRRIRDLKTGFRGFQVRPETDL